MKKELHVIAEDVVMDIEKKRIKNPRQVSKIRGSKLGYDIKSGGRHIEVKSSKRKITWNQLTSNETTAYKKDTRYYIYLVEFDEGAKTADVYAVPKKDLEGMEIHLEVVRFSALDSQKKRKRWLLRKGVSYEKYE